MSIKASEISDLIRQRIEKFAAATEERDVGTVVSVTDGICRIHGLADVCYGEMIEVSSDLFGLALNLEQDSVRAARWCSPITSRSRRATPSRPRAASSRCRWGRNCSAA